MCVLLIGLVISAIWWGVATKYTCTEYIHDEKIPSNWLVKIMNGTKSYGIDQSSPLPDLPAFCWWGFAIDSDEITFNDPKVVFLIYLYVWIALLVLLVGTYYRTKIFSCFYSKKTVFGEPLLDPTINDV